MGLEYRICWAADSNVTFRGSTDWERWGRDDDPEDALNALEDTDRLPNIPEGLDQALDASGFEWWVETREAMGGGS